MRHVVLKSTLCFLFTATLFGSNAQVSPDSAHHKLILKLDSLLFEVGFNQCELSQFDSLLSEDFEFFHDKSGFSNKPKFLVDLRNGLCGNRSEYKSRRALLSKFTQVYLLYNNGELYGILQEGIHQFYEQQKNLPETFASSARFTHLWVLERGVWKLSASYSFNHKETKLD